MADDKKTPSTFEDLANGYAPLTRLFAALRPRLTKDEARLSDFFVGWYTLEKRKDAPFDWKGEALLTFFRQKYPAPQDGGVEGVDIDGLAERLNRPWGGSSSFVRPIEPF